MTVRVWAAVAAAAVAVVSGPSGAAPQRQVLFRFADPRITEASGIASGVRSPGVFYVENDSGDSNRFFAVAARDGATVAVVTVARARNVDWEDIATAPDRHGTPSVWLADIGDNDAARRSVQVYRVAEPRLDPRERNRTVEMRAAQVWRLRYPGGPVDAESLAVGPDGTAYIVTKSLGTSTVYRLPARPVPGTVQPLQRVGRISFTLTGTDNPFGLPGQLVATSAAIDADATVFAVRTYADAWVWPLAGGGVGAALRRKPTVVPLPRQPQGEGLTVSAGRLIVDSEHVHSAVYAVPLPRLSAAPATGTAPAEAAASPAASGDAGRVGWLVLLGAALVTAAAAGAGVMRARRRR